MCLHVSHSYSRPRKGKGYKVFIRYRNNKNPYSEIYPGYPYIPGEWETANSVKVRDGSFHLYGSGFHIFTKLEDAKNWRDSESREIREVEYEQAYTFGQQSRRGYHCVVAQRMKVGKIVVRAKQPYRNK
jgi:hypothetical protein